MSSIPEGRCYSVEHEWIEVDGDLGKVGITEFAQAELGEVVYVELPSVGETFDAGETFGTVESTKAVSDLCAPVSGEVVEINEELEDDPARVNEAPYGEGWLLVLRLSEATELDKLMDAAAYEQFLHERSDD